MESDETGQWDWMGWDRVLQDMRELDGWSGDWMERDGMTCEMHGWDDI